MEIKQIDQKRKDSLVNLITEVNAAEKGSKAFSYPFRPIPYIAVIILSVVCSFLLFRVELLHYELDQLAKEQAKRHFLIYPPKAKKSKD